MKDKTYDKYSSGTLYSTDRDEYLYPDKQEKTEPETAKGVVCNAKHVKVRVTPKAINGNIITVVKEGAIVDITGKVDGFYQISLSDFPGRVLYISSDYCREV